MHYFLNAPIVCGCMCVRRNLATEGF